MTRHIFETKALNLECSATGETFVLPLRLQLIRLEAETFPVLVDRKRVELSGDADAKVDFTLVIDQGQLIRAVIAVDPLIEPYLVADIRGVLDSRLQRHGADDVWIENGIWVDLTGAARGPVPLQLTIYGVAPRQRRWGG